jgi:cytochrome c2
MSAFITSPQKYAPGTAMDIDGIPDADERAQIIDYIEHAPKVISR